MLFDDVISGARKAFRHKAETVVKKINRSGRFILDENSTRAMAQLAAMRPSRVVLAKDFLKMPFDSLWLEYLDPVRKSVFLERGGQLQEELHRTHPYRIGNLVWKDPKDAGKIWIWSTWNFGSSSGKGKGFFWTPMAVRFDLSLAADDEQIQGWLEDFRREQDLITRKHGILYKIRGNEDELRNYARLAIAMDFQICPFIKDTRYGKKLVSNSHLRDVQETINAFSEDVEQEVAFVVATLLLLNCRNGISQETVTPKPLPPNKRIGSRRNYKPRDYTIVKMRVPKGAMGTGGTSDTQRAAHWVMGHPKVRKTGVFWWSPHVRGSGEKPEAPTTRLVKA